MAYKLKFQGLLTAPETAEQVSLTSEVALTANTGTNSLRVEIEFEVDSLSATNTLCFANSNSCRIQIFSNGSVVVNFRDQNNFVNAISSATGLISVGVRYIVALELSNTDRNARVFLNDIEIITLTNRWGVFNIGTLGLWPSNSTLNGSIYRVTCYQNGAIVNDYDPSASSGAGTTLIDTVGGNNGTLVNFPLNNSQWVFYDDGGGGEPEFKFSVLPITLGLNQSYFVNKLVNTNINSSIGQLDFINENSKGAATQLNQALDLDFINENSKGAATQLNQVLHLDYYSEHSKVTRTTLPIGATIENTLTNKKLSSFSLPIDFSINSELSSRKYGHSSINENLELVSILSYIRQDNPGAGTIDIRFRLGSSYTHKKSASTTYYTDLICDSIYVNSKKAYNILYQSMVLDVISIANKNINSNIDSSMELASTVVHSKTASSTYSSSINLYQDYQVSKATRNPYQVNIGQLSISLTNFNLDNKQPVHKVTILSNETTVFRVNPVIFTVFRTTR